MNGLENLLSLMCNPHSEDYYLRRIQTIREMFGDEVADYIDDKMEGEYSPRLDGYVYYLDCNPDDMVKSCAYLLKELV